MTFSLLIYASAFNSQSVSSAWQFANALLNEEHKLHRVFFYGDAVLIANELISPPQDEDNLQIKWTSLAQQHQLDMVICVSAAIKRGILDNKEAQYHTKPFANLPAEFVLSGLGQLAESIQLSDRLITFGD